MRHLIASLLMVGCAGGVTLEGEGCVFDGTYEFGIVADQPSESCQSTTRTWIWHEYADDCSSSVDNLQGFLTCAQGNPVIECDGFGSLPAAGCTYSLYVRRVGP